MTLSMWIAIAGLLLVLVLVFLRVWIGFALMIVGFLGLILLRGFDPATKVLASEPFTQTAVYAFTCMPLFCLMGCIISNTGIGENLYDWAKKMIGHVKGGLGVATVIACGLFAAICGNSQVTAMTLGKVSYPEMRKIGYNEAISAGGIAAGGGIGIMIPPSIGFIIYGLITEQSIGRLFMAGLLPGILQVILYSAVFLIIGRIKPAWVPATPKATWRERTVSLKGVFPTLLLMAVILGGIYGGVFTATEAGAVGAAASLLIAACMRSLTKRNMYEAFTEGVRMTGMVMILVIGAKIFLRFVTVSKITVHITDMIVGMDANRYAVLAVVFLLYLVLGSVFDIMAGILLTVPFLFPIMTGLGFDPIWFGVFVVAMMELGEITPPIGLTCFIISGTVKLPVEHVFRGVLPFIAAALLFVGVICVFPEFCLLLA
jgi:tripartite ATP-independent transporter DctM subunit